MRLDEKALEVAALAALNDHRNRKGWPPIASIEGMREQDRVDWTNDARAAITAYLQALSPGSTGETEGWVLVPKEPTSAQLDRAVAFALNVSLGGDYRWTDYMRDLYGRFLSAAGER